MQAIPVAANVHPHKHKQLLGAMDVYVGAKGMRKLPEARWANKIKNVPTILQQKEVGKAGWITIVRSWLPTQPDPRPISFLPHVHSFRVSLRLKPSGAVKFRITNRHVRQTCSRAIPWGRWDGLLFPWPQSSDYIVLEIAQVTLNAQPVAADDEEDGPPQQSAITGILLPGQLEFEKVRAECRDAARGDTKPV